MRDRFESDMRYNRDGMICRTSTERVWYMFVYLSYDWLNEVVRIIAICHALAIDFPLIGLQRNNFIWKSINLCSNWTLSLNVRTGEWPSSPLSFPKHLKPSGPQIGYRRPFLSFFEQSEKFSTSSKDIFRRKGKYSISTETHLCSATKNVKRFKGTNKVDADLQFQTNNSHKSTECIHILVKQKRVEWYVERLLPLLLYSYYVKSSEWKTSSLSFDNQH